MGVILSDRKRSALMGAWCGKCPTKEASSNYVCVEQAKHLMQYLLGPCGKHGKTYIEVERGHLILKCRKDCPDCINEIKQELGIIC